MVEYENFIYLDVYRTGSTHLVELLREIADEPLVHEARHSSLTKLRPVPALRRKLVLASVRNPWDWYVSLWAYGAAGKSAIRRYLAGRFEPRRIASFYDLSAPEPSFRAWLAAIQDANVLNAVLREHLPESGLAGTIGLYTYRYLRVTTLYPRLLLRNWFIRSPEGAAAHHRRWKAYRFVLRTESLDDDLVAFVQAQGGRCRFKPDAIDRIRQHGEARRNASPRTLPSYHGYYDDESRALVARRDSFFVTTFGYRFE